MTGEPLFAQLWYGEALNFGKVSDWNRQLDLGRRLRVSSISIHADALLHARGAELLDQLADEQRKENVLGVWLDEYVQRARAFQTASIARDLDGNWLLFGDALRTVRLPVSEMTPEYLGDVVGYSDRTQIAIFSWRGIMPFSNPHKLDPATMEEGGEAPVLRLIRSKRAAEILASQFGWFCHSLV